MYRGVGRVKEQAMTVALDNRCCSLDCKNTAPQMHASNSITQNWLLICAACRHEQRANLPINVPFCTYINVAHYFHFSESHSLLCGRQFTDIAQTLSTDANSKFCTKVYPVSCTP